MSLMGVDIGTSGCKAVAFDEAGRTLSSAHREYDVIREEPGQAELSSVEVWERVREVVSACAAGTAKDPVEALSVASMGEALVPVDAAGEICGDSPLGMDTRGASYLERLKAAIPAAELYRITGNLPGMGFSLPNLCWLKENRPEVYRRTSLFLPWADFVCFKLAGEAFANLSLANRTLLYDLERREWSGKVADAVGLDLEKMPPLAPSGKGLGEVSGKLAAELGLPAGVKVALGTHDQCAAALGAGVHEANTAMLGLGTFACAVLVHREAGAGSPFRGLKLNIEDHAMPGSYVSFVYHGSGGALVKWLRDELFRDLKGEGAYQRMFDELATASDSPVVLPYFAGTGPLDCAAGGQGAICGLSLAHTRADILKGALEGIALYFKDAFSRLAASGRRIGRIHASGGGAESALWLQMIADILQTPVAKPRNKECGALGAAILGGLGAGLYQSCDEAVARLVELEHEYQPSPRGAERYAKVFERYSGLKTSLAISTI